MSDLPVYVVIGASGGMGSQVCRNLYAKGCHLMMGARHVEELDTLQADLPDTLYFCVFAEQIEDVVRCVEHAMNMWGRVDGIVYCEGNYSYQLPHRMEEEEWKKSLAVNLSAAFACVHSAGKFMLGDGGSVTLLTSAFAAYPAAQTETAAVAAGGVSAMVKSAAKSYQPFRIRFNAVTAGVVDGDELYHPEIQLPEGYPKHSVNDVAKVLTWLAATDCPLSGEVLGVADGLARMG